MPAAIRRAAEELARYRGVLGVFWGNPRRGGAWTGEQSLVVHVRKKLAAKRLGAHHVPPVIAGVRTDVIEVRRLSHHWLDPSDPVQCDDGERGRSTISALATKDGVVFALLSGHATLPGKQGKLSCQYDPAMKMRIRAVDPEGAGYDGRLEAGRLDAHCDFTLARMSCDADGVNTYHYGPGEYPPFTLRADPPRVAEEVAHYSSLRRRRMVGRIRQISAGCAYIPGHGGEDFPYLDLIVVESPDPAQPFSKKGDSGSLVVDRQSRVLGTIVAGDPPANISYVLPIAGLVKALGPHAGLFFKVEELR